MSVNDENHTRPFEAAGEDDVSRLDRRVGSMEKSFNSLMKTVNSLHNKVTPNGKPAKTLLALTERVDCLEDEMREDYDAIGKWSREAGERIRRLEAALGQHTAKPEPEGAGDGKTEPFYAASLRDHVALRERVEALELMVGGLVAESASPSADDGEELKTVTLGRFDEFGIELHPAESYLGRVKAALQGRVDDLVKLGHDLAKAKASLEAERLRSQMLSRHLDMAIRSLDGRSEGALVRAARKIERLVR